jgi:hypothetical protein
MQRQHSALGIFSVIAAGIVLLFFTVGCSTTAPPRANIVTGNRPLPVQSGFLGDYSQLTPRAADRMALLYINPNVNWNTYTKIILEPVQFWDSANTTVPASDQRMLASYLYSALRESLQNDFTLVDQPGPGVLKLEAAIIDASASTPVLRSVSVILPQAFLLNRVQSLGTGSYAFVGSAQVEGQITDSMTGTRLAAAVDQRQGGMSIRTATQGSWGDAKNILDFWAQRTAQRLIELRTQGKTSE